VTRLTSRAASCGYYFFAHEVQADDSGSLRSIFKVATDRILDRRAELFEPLCLGMNSVAESTGGVSTVRFVFANFKDDLGHKRVSS
jgi:hypothetical protein